MTMMNTQPSCAPVSRLIPDYNSAASLRSFLENRNLGMRKKYGQNFLINSAARNKLLDELGINAGEEVWEIGPGLGAMTKGLLDREARVTALEIDPAFSNILRELFKEYDNFCLIEGDALKTWQKVPKEKEVCLIGNLPYNIGAALLGDFIEKKCFFSRMVVTVQKETAQRMTARPGTKSYSSFTVLCSSAYKITPLMILKGSSFFPVPHVDSQAVRLDLLKAEDRPEYSRLFYQLVRALFSSRRKTLQNNLSTFAASVIMDKVPVIRILEEAGIDGSRRAETLDIKEFAALAKALEDKLNRDK
jgi:16S rRNA (adenine1518-N6/adenine1519-N6)-dimethyltransferase